MSKDLSARSGNGDAASSSRKDSKMTADSGSSTYRRRTDEDNVRCVGNAELNRDSEIAGFEGPYGDSPPTNQGPCQSEYIIFMLNNDDSTPASEYDSELYTLHENYIEELNKVRRRLNLMDIKDSNCSSAYQERCQIAEITEDPQWHGEIQSTEVEENKNADTIWGDPENSFSLKYDNLQNIQSSYFESEYTPPKKKSCNRLKTPTLLPSLENTIPYHTKVSLRDDLFKNTTDEVINPNFCKDCGDNFCLFTKHEETQCEIQSEYCFNQNCESNINEQNCLNPAISDFKVNEAKNLFPKIIVKQYYDGSSPSLSVYSEEEQLADLERIDRGNAPPCNVNMPQAEIQKTNNYYRITTPHCSAADKKNVTISDTRDFFNKSFPNFAHESTDENYDTRTTSTTTILENASQKHKNSSNDSRNKPKKSSLWNEIKQIHPNRLQAGREKMEKQYLVNKKKTGKRYSIQKRDYKLKTSVKSQNHSEKPKSTKFGPELILGGSKQHYTEHRYFYFSSDTDYNSSVFDSEKSPRVQKSFVSCWKSLFKWFLQVFQKNK